jgi:hypothetical protein
MPSEFSFNEAHNKVLPERLSEQWGKLAASQVRDVPSLAIGLSDGPAYTYSYRADESSIELLPGTNAATVVEVNEADWLGLWDSTETILGLVMSGRATLVSGDVADFVSWEPAIRVLYEKLPPYDSNAPLLGADGRVLDPSQAFHPDDDPDRMAEFLRVMGYIVVREVLPEREVDELARVAERARAAATEDDGTSWWSTREDGGRYPSRVLNGGSDKRMLALPSDPRLLRIVGLSDYEFEPTPNEYVSILYKQSRVVFDGKADQPWHRDCGIGGHKHMCPMMNGSLFLNEGNRDSGELRFLPGSWQTAGCAIDDPNNELGVGVAAGPGDFSLHYGDGLHAGTPPESEHGPFRSSVVFEYGLAGRTVEQNQEYYDQIMLETDARVLGKS